MTLRDRWLLPEGVDEILPPRAALLEQFCRRVMDLYSTCVYELVMPPLIEFLDSLLTGTGSDLELQTFKLTDQLTGRLMGLRADMTPQVARFDDSVGMGRKVALYSGPEDFVAELATQHVKDETCLFV
jgi:ATP phosphoribosyltransferase regulatory subunit